MHNKMSEQTAASLRKRAVMCAMALGYGSRSEDIAQMVMLHYIRGKGDHQKLDFAIIDIIRHEFGRPGERQYETKNSLTLTGLRADPYKGIKNQPSCISPVPGKIDFHSLVSMVKCSQTQDYLILRYHEGYTLPEISNLSGKHETTISQMIQHGLRQIRRALHGESFQIPKAARQEEDRPGTHKDRGNRERGRSLGAR